MTFCARRTWRLAAASVLLLGIAACGSSGGPGATVAARTHDPLCNFQASVPAVYKHVIWIWFENTDEQDVVSGSNAGTYTSSLIDRCGLAVNYHNISHPSLPNYVAATSGAVQGAADVSDCAPSACPQSQPSLFDQVQAAGMQWREYAQAQQGPCSATPDEMYTSLATQCKSSEVSLGEPQAGTLHNDLASSSLPAFAFVLPDDANDIGPPADAFLAQWVPAITSSASYKDGTTALLITWDEGGTDRTPGESCDDTAHADVTKYPGCQVAFIALGPSVGTTRTSDYFNHYSLLRTTEEMLGITTYLGKAASAHSMRTALHL